MPRVDHPFAIVPINLVSDPNVSDAGVRAYAVLAEAASTDGTCWPSHETIGERIGGKSRWTAKRACDELEAAGWIVVTGRADESGGQTSNEYMVLRVQGTPPSKSATRTRPTEPDPF